MSDMTARRVRRASAKNQPRHRDAAKEDPLLRVIDEAYDRKSWHGPTLRGAVRGLTAEANARHMLRGIALHDVYHAGQIQLLKRLRGTR